MMNHPCAGAWLALVLCACTVSVAPAQSRQPVSLEASVGLGSAVGGPQARHRTGASADALLGLRVGALPHGSLVVGVAAGIQGALTRNDVCALTPGGGCIPEFPLFVSVGPVAGWENREGTLRLLAGVASFHPDTGDPTVGIDARLDLCARPGRHLAPVVSLRAGVLPSYEGAVVGLGGIGIGLRVR